MGGRSGKMIEGRGEERRRRLIEYRIGSENERR